MLISEAVDPLKDVVKDHGEQIAAMKDDMAKLRIGLPEVATPNRRDKFDPAHCQVSFGGFADASVEARAAILQEFMKSHFGAHRYVCVGTRMTGPFGEGRKASKESYIKFGDRDARDRALKLISDRKLTACDTSGKSLKISRMKTASQRYRDFAIGKVEELIKAKMDQVGKQGNVKYVKTKDVRKITVDDMDAFVQMWSDDSGNFLGDFSDLRLARQGVVRPG